MDQPDPRPTGEGLRRAALVLALLPACGGGAEPLAKDRDVVVYCTDVACVASQMAYHAMVAEGYTNVRRYAGGLSDWDEAGYELATGGE